MTTSRNNTIMSWMAYTEFFYPGCELQPGYFYPSMPELFYYTLEDGACIGAAGIDAYFFAPSSDRYVDLFKTGKSGGLEYFYSKPPPCCQAFALPLSDSALLF